VEGDESETATLLVENETKTFLSIDRKGKETVATEKTGVVDIRVLSKIQQEHRDLEDVDIWGEMVCTGSTSDGGQMLRGDDLRNN
jgi:hypothetical protein